MIDIALYLIHEKKVEDVVVVMRRGPTEIKFTRKELENVVGNIDFKILEDEFSRVDPILKTVDQNIEEARKIFLDGLPNAEESNSATKLRFEFLASPVSILGDWTKGVSSLKVEDNTLIKADGNVKPRGLGTTRHIEANTVIFAIGDTVDKEFSLPIFGDAYSINPDPGFPVEGISYEAFDNDVGASIRGVFLAGWARQASNGLVGVARKDGENAAKAVLQYLQHQPPLPDPDDTLNIFSRWLHKNFQQVVSKENLIKLESAEQEEMEAREVEDFKFSTNEDMLRVMGI
jgi:ferredoxin--NADP+ reductase